MTGIRRVSQLGTIISTGVSNSAGMVFLSKTNFTGVSGVVIDNVFSSLYSNYKIILDITSSPVMYSMRFIESGSINNTNNYGYWVGYAVASSITATRNSGTSNGGLFSQNAGQIGFSGSFILLNPQDSTKTTSYSGSATSSNGSYSNWFTGGFGLTNSFAGITFNGTDMAGTISIYGYLKE